jgi:hypothetical protein
VVLLIAVKTSSYDIALVVATAVRSRLEMLSGAAKTTHRFDREME